MLKKITLQLLKVFIKNFIHKITALTIAMLVGFTASYGQFSPPNNCQDCYINYTDEAAIQQCLIDYNCVNDIPIDNGAFFLFLAGILLIYITIRYRFKTV